MAARRQLVARVGEQVRRMGAQTVLISKAVASRFGLNTTDLECLDLIFLRGHASAGELAKATGLTSGAVTALIDRLEEAGYVQRTDDPADRRRREVRIKADAVRPIQAAYQPMQARMFELWSSYSTRDLELIADFIARSTEVAVACTEALQADARHPHERSRRASIPRA